MISMIIRTKTDVNVQNDYNKKCDNILKQDVPLEINKIIIQDTYDIKNSSSNKREIAIKTRVIKIMIIKISIIKILIIITTITAIIISVISICH